MAQFIEVTTLPNHNDEEVECKALINLQYVFEIADVLGETYIGLEGSEPFKIKEPYEEIKEKLKECIK